MDESAAPASADSETSSDTASTPSKLGDQTVVIVADGGDIILEVTFETSEETLKRCKKAAVAAKRKNTNGNSALSSSLPPATLQPKVTVSYRVSLDSLRKHSKYFANLLTNPQFSEARRIRTAHEGFALRKIKPGEASAHELPRVSIVDDDEATQTAGRNHALEDMLRMMHQKPIKATRVVMSYVTTLAIIADRFDCVGTVSRALAADVKFKWPVSNTRPYVDDAGRVTDVEKVLRQKILVAWLLGQAMRLHQASRELIMRGSRLWGAYRDDDAASDMTAVWWNLPEGIEEELQHRRECILNTIASVQHHFLGLYASRERQCKLGYDSSAACDSFQFGQMIKFLLSKELLFLADFSPASVDALPDMSHLDIEELLTMLKQCPNYQVDKHHTNCGLRIRIDPILDYLRAMLSSNSVSIPYADWKQKRNEVSWILAASRPASSKDRFDEENRGFAFTRALATDQRLRYEGAIYTDRMARSLFTADAWDWTPET